MSLKSRVVCINQFGSPSELKIEEKEIDDLVQGKY